VAKGETTACRKKATYPRELYTWRVRSCSRGLHQHPSHQGRDRRMTNRPRRIHAPVRRRESPDRRNSTGRFLRLFRFSRFAVVVVMARSIWEHAPAPRNPENSRLRGWRRNERTNQPGPAARELAARSAARRIDRNSDSSSLLITENLRGPASRMCPTRRSPECDRTLERIAARP